MALIVWPAGFGASFSTMVPITERLAVAEPLDACSTVGSEVLGKIALIQRGSCTFDVKVLNAQNAGALAVIVFNNVDGPGIVMGGAEVYGQITIPAAMITLQEGRALQAALEANVLEIMVPILGEAESSAHMIADFSSRGPTAELRLKPDVLCPGVDIHSDMVITTLAATTVVNEYHRYPPHTGQVCRVRKKCFSRQLRTNNRITLLFYNCFEGDVTLSGHCHVHHTWAKFRPHAGMCCQLSRRRAWAPND